MVLAVAWWLTEYTETNILRHELDCQFVRQDESVRLGSQTVKSQGYNLLPPSRSNPRVLRLSARSLEKIKSS